MTCRDKLPFSVGFNDLKTVLPILLIDFWP